MGAALPLIMHRWLTIPQWLTVSSLTSKCETAPSSPLLSLLPVCFSSVSSLSPSQLSLPHCPFSFFPFSCHSLCIKPSPYPPTLPQSNLHIKSAAGLSFKNRISRSSRPVCLPTAQLAAALVSLHWQYPISLPLPVYCLFSACCGCSSFHEEGLL